ncbi:MAG TPA: membrane protein insertase YidC [Gemmatimonadaceae bacterium]|jgi:YidC/Oxa1 family membrane protein insertase|nr:membrane protein insertase YidC [Gemmatimonadaceae bacterium]
MDKRFFLALFLSLVVIAITQLLFPSAKPTPASRNAKDSTARTASSTAGSAASSTVAVTPNQVSAVAPGKTATSGIAISPDTATVRAETTVVETPKAIYKFSSVGAAPTAVVIRDYKSRATNSLVDLGNQGSSLLGYRILSPSDTVDLSRTAFALARSRTPSAEVLVYTASVGARSVSLTYTIPVDTMSSYSMHVDGRVTGGASPSYLITELPKTLRPTEADTLGDHRTLAYSFKPQRDRAGSVLFGSLDPGEKRLETGPLSWVAVKNKYFVVGVLAPVNGSQFSEVTLTGGPRTSKVANTASAAVVDEIHSGAFAFDIYAGPQESQRLMRMGRDFDHVNPYGWRFLQGVVHPIASKVIQGLLWMHNRLNLSYGWVLIILGVLVRLALWPLNQSTMRSSLKMQELQPKLAAAQKKYKDPVQQREAIMKVYRDAGVSPFAGLTGCLPALLPMPILFALFFVFQNTIEFRGVPFFWLHDISVKDPFYVLPLLMGASMYMLSWIGMRTAPPNPQAKMMGYMFPLMMTVVLLNMASGLNLYYTAQNIAALPQQWMLARERAKVRPAG